MIVNRAQLAESMGVSLPTIDTWVREGGCPVKSKGGRGRAAEYDLAAVVKWWGERERRAAGGEVPDDMDTLKMRKMAAEAEQAELDLAKAKDMVAPIDEFRRVEEARAAIIRTNMLNVVNRAVLQLLGETDETIFKQKLRGEIVLALETAAKTAIELADDEDGEDADG